MRSSCRTTTSPPSLGPEPLPEGLKVGEPVAGQGADDHPGVPLQLRDLLQHVDCRLAEMDDLGPGLGGGQVLDRYGLPVGIALGGGVAPVPGRGDDAHGSGARLLAGEHGARAQADAARPSTGAVLDDVSLVPAWQEAERWMMRSTCEATARRACHHSNKNI